MRIETLKVIEDSDLQKVRNIRTQVFIVEQNCPEDIEWEFEEESKHYLALLNGEPVGTARWRITDHGIKLERFAVLKEARGKGVASALVEKLLDEVKSENKKKYLHAQLQAAPLYAKFGFKPVGENFWEADIEHIKMERY